MNVKYGMVSLACTVLDLRGFDVKTLGTVVLTADTDKSVSTLCVEMAEHLRKEGLVENFDWKQVIFHDGLPVIESLKSLKSCG